ncbi:uncharacterized protein LOC107045408 [Diachasma alloeum]|uniref:uncharacterized protein LOC107045408 n=1 Tax=Diachasma alloeum TaxID=454923 RepID=UPI0007382A7C|nr:uncharacterized protein LOC107045408 [Diachasma alloeum]
MTASTIKTWLTRGEFEKLEHYVLEGKGARLLNEHSPDLRTRVFLKGLPTYLSKISQAHEAVTRGALAELQKIIADEPKKKLAIAKDAAGIPLLHKAVYHDHQDVVEWLLDNYPNTAVQKDREGRTALHFCVACKDPESIWDLLIEGGCDASVCDKRGHPAAYYLEHASEIELPDAEAMATKPSTAKSESLDFKPSNIRIWIHNRDIAKLQQVLWEGHGSKLKCEISNNPRVRRFLEATPFIMGTIKQIHNAVVKNDIEGFLEKIADPVSPVILCSKDMNGLNVLHKAAGFGYLDIAREILERYPAAALAQDNDGKTPLHYGAAVRDGGAMYELLTEYGADESKLDNRNKAAAFYKNRPGDIDLSNLVVIPEAPRVSGTKYPKHWDWRILDNDGMSLRALKKLDAQVDVDSAFGSAESALKSAESSDNVFGMTDEEGLKDDLVGQDEQPDEKENDDAADEGGDENEETEGGEEAAADEEAAPEEEGDAAADEEGEAAPEEGEEEAAPEEEGEEEAAPEEEAEEEAAPEEGEEEEAAPETEGEEEAAPNEEEEEPAPDEEQEEPAVEPEEADDDAEVQEGELDQENEEEKPDDADSGNIEEPADDEAQEEEKNEPSTGDSGVDESRLEDDQVIAGEHEEVLEADLNDGDNLDDPEIDDLLVNGNMEQLASVVLNGEGRRLVNRQSSNPELQAFIDNVPSYIGKIHAVHIAAREGNLRDLQNALDRRKFAIARDGASPHGATPLHVAVIFGHTSVIRYLAGRFPETTHAVDIDGRTPLHYAATLADNGHYYNLLLHLGANPLTLDNFGQKADYYKENQSDLSHKQLLRDFGAREELADEMLTDKVGDGDIYSARRDVNEADILSTLERCFRLLVPTRRGSVLSTASANAGTILGRCLKRTIFDQIKHRVTRMDHNLFDIIWPSVKKYSINHPNGSSYTSASSRRSSIPDVDDDFAAVIVAPDYESYIVFAELFDPFIRNLHCVTATGDLPDQPLSCFFTDVDSKVDDETLEEVMSTLSTYDIDPTGKYVQVTTIDACRNLESFTLPLTLTINQLEETERRITGILMSAEVAIILAEGSSEDEAGTYYTLNEILERPSDIRVRLEAAGLLGPILETELSDERRLHGKHWPYGRGVYVASAGDVAVWVNVQDHIRIICRTHESHPGMIGKAYVRIARILSIFDRRMRFKKDRKLGFLSARPASIGNTMRFCCTAKLSGLSKQSDNLKQVCITRGLRVTETMRSDVFKISNLQCLTITELQTLQDFIRAIRSVLGLEKEMVLTNSLKIATLVTNIFRKRKNSIFKG